MLDHSELEDLYEKICEQLPEKLLGALSKANRIGELEALLDALGLSELIEEERFDTLRNGKIVVIAGDPVKERDLLGVVKELGIEKERFEFMLDYDGAKNYNYGKLQYNPSYRLILFGSIPHSTVGTGDYGSVVTKLEKTKGYPRAVRLVSNGELKLTKSNFREKLCELLKENYI